MNEQQCQEKISLKTQPGCPPHPPKYIFFQIPSFSYSSLIPCPYSGAKYHPSPLSPWLGPTDCTNGNSVGWSSQPFCPSHKNCRDSAFSELHKPAICYKVSSQPVKATATDHTQSHTSQGINRESRLPHFPTSAFTAGGRSSLRSAGGRTGGGFRAASCSVARCDR